MMLFNQVTIQPHKPVLQVFVQRCDTGRAVGLFWLVDCLVVKYCEQYAALRLIHQSFGPVSIGGSGNLSYFVLAFELV